MYRPIVSQTMRNQIRTNIAAPQFCNLRLAYDGYVISISFRITEEMHLRLQNRYPAVKTYGSAGKYYIHWEKTYPYWKPFYDAFQEAYRIKAHLKVLMRQIKIDILEDEIDTIKWYE